MDASCITQENIHLKLCDIVWLINMSRILDTYHSHNQELLFCLVDSVMTLSTRQKRSSWLCEWYVSRILDILISQTISHNFKWMFSWVIQEASIFFSFGFTNFNSLNKRIQTTLMNWTQKISNDQRWVIRFIWVIHITIIYNILIYLKCKRFHRLLYIFINI